MSRPAVFVEPCAGLANLSIRLAAGGDSRGPVGRFGAKAKYADAILDLLGLAPGMGADRYLWAEADPAVRAVLRAYPDPEILSGAAEQIAAWEQEDALLLWERLRHAGPISETSPEEVARWVALLSSNRLINVAWDETRGRFSNTGNGGDTFGGPEFCNLARGRAGLERLVGIEWSPVEVASDARSLLRLATPEESRRAVVFIDPPYRATSGYGFQFGRRDVIRLALSWVRAGALVAISEAEPIAALARLGWSVVEITRRVSGKRTHFSKQQREFLTISGRPRSGGSQ